MIYKALPLIRNVIFLTKAKQSQLMDKAFEFKSKDTSYFKLFFSIVKILQIIKFHYLTLYFKNLKSIKFYLIRQKYNSFCLTYQANLILKVKAYLLLNKVRGFWPKFDKNKGYKNEKFIRMIGTR